MEHIKNILPKAIATLALSTKERAPSTPVTEKFKPFQTLADSSLVKMKAAAVTFADDLLAERNPRWLVLLGPSGVGKTMCAKLIWQLFKTDRHLAINWPASDPGRLVRWRGGFLNWGEAVSRRMLQGDYEFLDDLRAYDFFVLDDIVSEYEKHHALSAAKLYEVLDARLGKWTVITANLSLQEIGEKLDQRIASRMIRNTSSVVEVDSQDWNLRQK